MSSTPQATQPFVPAELTDVFATLEPLETFDQWRMQSPANGRFHFHRELRRARGHLLRLSIPAGLDLLAGIESRLDQVSDAAARRLRPEVNALRALAASFQDDSHSALQFARAQSGDGEPSACATTVCRFVYWRHRDLEAFYSLPRKSLSSGAGRRTGLLDTLDSSMEAAVEFEQLRLAMARRLAIDSLQAASRRFRTGSAICAAPASVAAMVAYEQGFISEAVDLVRGRLTAIGAAGSLDCVLRAYWVLARAAGQRGEHDSAFSLWREAEQLGRRRGWPRLVAMSCAERIRSFAQQGLPQLARRETVHLDRLLAENFHSWRSGAADVLEYRTLPKALLGLTEEPSFQCFEALRRLHQHLIRRKSLHAALSVAVYMVSALERLGAVQEAEQLLLSILRSARAAGAFQLVLDGGTEALRVLRRLHDQASRGNATERELLPYIVSLLGRAIGPQVPEPKTRAHSALTNGLSPRERDILALVGRGLTNKRIAYALTITPETVKSHVKRIFSKLEVHTRAEAVSRCVSEGLMRNE
jgi:ATP/maltotriose-dependent transcriptional regulator MalT